MKVKRKSNQILERQYRKQGSCCYYCKTKIEYDYITRDHIIPISKGHSLVGNKIFACEKCNMMKSNLSIIEFRDKVFIRIKEILQTAVDNKFMMSSSAIKKFKNMVVILKTLNEMIENDGMPNIIFS